MHLLFRIYFGTVNFNQIQNILPLCKYICSKLCNKRPKSESLIKIISRSLKRENTKADI